jgi:hypothetical protein
MDAWLLVAASVVSSVCMTLAYKTRGAVFSLAGGLLTLYVGGLLVANQTVSVGNIVGACAPGVGVGPNCGYNLVAADVQGIILIFSIFTITSFLIAADILWPRTGAA